MADEKSGRTNTVLQVFAKAPVPGEVNTRLIPHIGVELATSLQDELIQCRLDALTKSKLCKVQLWCSPDTDSAYFKTCRKRYHVELIEQVGNNLGERMHNAVQYGLQEYSHVIIIGTDAPALTVEQIAEAMDHLEQGNDVVIVPAEDGGYVLIGMNNNNAAVFDSVVWGSSQVYEKTISNISAAGLKLSTLQPCWDIDRVEDYHRYKNNRHADTD